MHKRVLSGQTLEKPTLAKNVLNPKEFLKDPYVFEFLNIAEPYNASESQIETALVKNLESFLLELGKGFSFV